MSMTRWFAGGLAVVMFAAGFAVRGMNAPLDPVLHAQASRVFEIRTYTAAEGKLDALKARFRDHTIKVFNKYGMVSIGYWTPLDGQTTMPANTLVYILAHPSREAAAKAWASFGADPEWVKAKADSEAGGRLTTKVESVFVNATDFSPIK
jgi:hypothetical protein